MTAHFTPAGQTEPVAETSSFYRWEGTDQDGVWRLDPRMHLPLGYYDVSVDITDAEGVTTIPSAGYFNNVVLVSIEDVVVNRHTVTYTQRSVHVTGRLMGLWPDTGYRMPLAGEPVDVAARFDQQLTVTTKANGTFAATVTFDRGSDLDLGFGYDPDHPYYSEPTGGVDIPIALDPAPTKLTTHLSKTRANYGTTLTLTGTATWRSPSGWVPVANAHVGAMVCADSDPADYCAADAGEATTDAQGNYSITTTAATNGHFRVALPSDDRWVATAIAFTPELTVLYPATFTDFYLYRDDSGQAVVHGRLDFGPLVPVAMPIEIQFRQAGTTTWTTVAQRDVGDLNGSFEFPVDQPAAGAWRAHYAGVPDQFQAATSEVFRLGAA